MAKGECPVASAYAWLVAVAATAVLTYSVTKRAEEEKFRAIMFQKYQDEKAAKERLAEARKQAKEPPSGTVLEGVTIDKVFLWKLEDLRLRFASANIENRMKCKPGVDSLIRSPMLRGASSTLSDSGEDGEEELGQAYNKIISDDQCILSKIVRKPGMETHTVGYVRAGPRKFIHFDPDKVNAAIVTCGGLCPGLNNVIREITKTLHQLYGIKGTYVRTVCTQCLHGELGVQLSTHFDV